MSRLLFILFFTYLLALRARGDNEFVGGCHQLADKRRRNHKNSAQTSWANQGATGGAGISGAGRQKQEQWVGRGKAGVE